MVILVGNVEFTSYGVIRVGVGDRKTWLWLFHRGIINGNWGVRSWHDIAFVSDLGIFLGVVARAGFCRSLRVVVAWASHHLPQGLERTERRWFVACFCLWRRFNGYWRIWWGGSFVFLSDLEPCVGIGNVRREFCIRGLLLQYPECLPSGNQDHD